MERGRVDFYAACSYVVSDGNYRAVGEFAVNINLFKPVKAHPRKRIIIRVTIILDLCGSKTACLFADIAEVCAISASLDIKSNIVNFPGG